MTDEQSEPSTFADRLDEAFAAYVQAAETGHPPDKEEFLSQYPELAEDVAAHECFDRLTAPVRELVSATIMSESPEQSIAAGTVFGDYELLEEIGRGGMGVVFRARQVTLNRTVALKMILFGPLAAEEDVKRFHTEAEAAANLQHGNIVTIHEVGQHEGQHYFSMDYVEGRSLAEVVRENPLPARTAAEYVRTIAEAIHYAHEQGTLHRDLKPSNCLIDQSDRLRITDFGLAKRIEDDSKLTVSHTVLGTPSYMPPEQVKAQYDMIGRASDVYSLGATLYELLTGRPPFRAETPLETLNQVIDAEPVSPRLLNQSVPRDLETICLKCLEKDPEQRYETAKELADELGRFQRGEPIHAKPIGRAGRIWRWCRRNPLGAGLTATATLLLIAVTTTVILMVAARKARYVLFEERVQKQSHKIHSRFSQYESLVEYLRGRAVELLKQEASLEQKPADDRVDCPSVFLASDATVNQMTQQRAMMLLPAFKRTMERSVGLLTGERLVWVYTATEKGVDYTWPRINVPPPPKYDPRKRKWYTQAKDAKGRVIWVVPYEDAFGQGTMISCSAPIHDSDNFLGVAGFDLREEFVISEMLKIKGQPYAAFLVDGNGKVLIQNMPEKLPEEVVEGIRKKREGRIRTDDKLAAYFRLGVNDWYYVVVTDWDHIQEALDSMQGQQNDSR